MVPSSGLDFQPFFGGFLFPVGKDGVVFVEIDIFLVVPAVGSDEYYSVVHHFLQGVSSCGEHGVYSADLVAYFPTGLEDIIRFK